VSIGYGHAGATPGDPGGEHNYNPLAGRNTADMYTLAWKHKLDKQLTWYFDTALTINHGNAHYDLGAGGLGPDHRLPRRYQHGIRGLQRGRTHHLGRLSGAGLLDWDSTTGSDQALVLILVPTEP